MPYVLTEGDRELAKRCGRAWDFGARERRNREPLRPQRLVDLPKALADALAIYYYPGMWEWTRSIVHPLVLQRFERSMVEHRDRFEAAYSLTAPQRRRWDQDRATGEALLGRYFDWAPTVDRFTPVRVEDDFSTWVIDPDRPGRVRLTHEGRGIRFTGRVPVVAADDQDRLWLVEHHFVAPGSPPPTADLLRLEDRMLARWWGWQGHHLYEMSGEIHNLIALDPAAGEPLDRIVVERERTELETFEERLSAQAADLARPDPPTGPRPSPEHCGDCAYRRPCQAMNEGERADRILDQQYQPKTLSPALGLLGQRGPAGRGGPIFGGWRT